MKKKGRCLDSSTPVHAAAFSCCPSILSMLVEAGGDFRLHDHEGRTPYHWAEAAGSEKNHKMLAFIRSCQSEMWAVSQCSDTRLRQSSGSAQLSAHSSWSLPFLPFRQQHWKSPVRPAEIYSFGFGKLFKVRQHYLGFVASIPVAAEEELTWADTEPNQTYENGPYTLMRNLLWSGQRVSVKELKPPSHPNCSKPRGSVDLLLAEKERSSHLHHPNLLLLMAVSLSSDLDSVRLVYERVEIGSLYSVLHDRRGKALLLQAEVLLSLLLQVCEALLFLHSRGCVHRALTSHAVQLVKPGLAKLTNLEYMTERHGPVGRPGWADGEGVDDFWPVAGS
nr:PREDICTED: inactive serine/threonine-protein kinase TEX14-like [Latimeria chalumnae]|eukprot:XP_006008207.2 PREDICTED: inactive serine/threonine-protein kinase TEX14-like [Latimeria chalumnae]